MQNATEDKPKKRNRLVLGIVIGAVGMLLLELTVFVVAFLIARPHLHEKIAEKMTAPALPNQKTDYDWTLQTPDGEAVDLAAYRGKVMFITLWKPGCPACKAHLPAIQRLHDLVNDPDAVFLPIAMEDAEDAEEVAQRHGLMMPYYVFEGAAPAPFDAGGAPATYIVDRSGTVALRKAGAAQWDDPTVVEFIRRLLVQIPGTETPPATE